MAGKKSGGSGRPKTSRARGETKKPKTITILDQWVSIRVEDGKTITDKYPSNEELRREGERMDPAPSLVYRRLDFVNGVPAEYHWATRDPYDRQYGGCGIQRMSLETWLKASKVEDQEAEGHVKPTGKGNLPRPMERGGCECAVCSENAGKLEELEGGRG